MRQLIVVLLFTVRLRENRITLSNFALRLFFCLTLLLVVFGEFHVEDLLIIDCEGDSELVGKICALNGGFSHAWGQIGGFSCLAHR